MTFGRGRKDGRPAERLGAKSCFVRTAGMLQAFEQGAGVTVFDKLEIDYKRIDGETSICLSICRVVECHESVTGALGGGDTAVSA